MEAFCKRSCRVMLWDIDYVCVRLMNVVADVVRSEKQVYSKTIEALL